MAWKVWDEYVGYGMGEESLGLWWKAYSGCKGPRNSVEAKDGHGEPDMDVKGLVWLSRT